ncbi:ABC transporter ATP-binding protein [Pseudomonas sp. NBRC 111119]|uniref:ABC transporter ATP-binding protein n=1 Tax=Pseudomonas sp. NBRC 111119 TaxID=1661034 RepID=UPI0007621E4F|nr:ABC transporter ATP-binding protein [Pseudomonas sp. NBRC 111119]
MGRLKHSGHRFTLPQGGASGSADLNMWQWILPFAAPQWPRFAAVALLSLVVAAAGLAQPYLSQRLIDDGMLKGDFDTVLVCVSAMVALAVACALLGGVTRYLHTHASSRMLHGMREDMFKHLLTLSPHYFSSTRQGDIHTRLNADMAELQRFVVDSVFSVMNNTLMFAGAVIMLGYMSAELLAVLAAVLLVNAVFLRMARAHVERLSQETRERGTDIAAFLMETLGLVKCVQAFNGQARSFADLIRLHERQRVSSLKLQVVGYAVGSLPALVMSVSIALVFLVGAQRIAQGSLTLGVLIAFVTYMQRASAPVQALASLYTGYQRAKVSVGRVRELAQECPLITNTASARAVRGRGHLAIHQVTFAYPGSNRQALRAVTVDIPAGSRVLVTGASGSGKSTLVDLLQRHFDPDDGRILLDGVDLREHSLEHLRRRVAVVSQTTELFSSSLLENIRYGRPCASDDEVCLAARVAGVEAFAKQLEHGLDTLVGQRGSRLSGGQRQRIALARAILLKPRILILDESTSGVDSAMEAQILRDIDALFAGSTRILITHRPVVAFHADRVIDLNETGAGCLQ